MVYYHHLAQYSLWLKQNTRWFNEKVNSENYHFKTQQQQIQLTNKYDKSNNRLELNIYLVSERKKLELTAELTIFYLFKLEKLLLRQLSVSWYAWYWISVFHFNSTR